MSGPTGVDESFDCTPAPKNTGASRPLPIAASAPAGGNFKRVDPANRYSPYTSAAGAQIVFFGKKSKLFCRRDRVRLRD